MNPGDPPAPVRDRWDPVDLTRQLVRTPSPNPGGDERAVAALVADVLVDLGLPAPTVVAADPARPNLITTIDLGPGGSHLVLSGHLDTKPVGEGRWQVDPWAAEVDGDRVYGLGAADMKGGLAALLVAAARVAGSLTSGTLSLVLTADEENSSALGAHHLAPRLELEPDGLVIAEPGGIEVDFDRLHLVSRGLARTVLSAHAAQGHSSLSGRPGTRNAGLDLARALVAQQTVELPTPPDEEGLAGWRSTVNPALRLEGGVGYGVLPGRVQALTEVRTLPGQDRDQVLAALAEAARRGAGPGADVRVEYDEPPYDWLPATRVRRDSRLARAAVTAFGEVLRTVPVAAVFPGTTDATWFSAARGWPVLPALGPGLLRRAHRADEWVSATAVRVAADLYTELAADFCTSPPPR